jgi:hypothetical protein
VAHLNKYIAAILMDLSKAFDGLPHDLILLKPEAYGLSEKSINLLNSYLSGKIVGKTLTGG